MKLRIGTKLNQIREQQKLSQDEISEKLNMSKSTYARYERNETNMDLETLAKVAKELDVPLHEFLPETFQINNAPHNSQGGIVFGNFIYNANNDDASKEMDLQIKLLNEKLKIIEQEKDNLLLDKQNLLKQIEFLHGLLTK